MPTSSLASISRLLNANSLSGMAAKLGLRRPVSARQIISQASFTFLPGWELVTSSGILRDERQSAWHAGHLNDVLPFDPPRVLVASDTGGVWLASVDGSSPTVPLSNLWQTVDMDCLSAGPKGPKHAYAAGREGALFETETESVASVARFLHSTTVREIAAKLHLAPPISVREILRLTDAPLFDWKQIAVVGPARLPLPAGRIKQLLWVPDLQPPKLVLATDRGLFWSDIPALGREYRFSPATGAPIGNYLGMALATNSVVVASPTGDPKHPESNGLYFGSWESGNLVMKRARHFGDIDFVSWNDGVVAACAGNRSVLYAAVSASGWATLRRAFQIAGLSGPVLRVRDLARKVGIGPPISLAALIAKVDPPRRKDFIYAVLVSKNGGEVWSPVGPHQKVEESIRFPRDPGKTQGGYNISIAVSNANPDTVALGWQSGPWIGTNTPDAFTWEERAYQQGQPGVFSPHIHPDFHGMQFDVRDPSGSTLYACSDGGLVFTKDHCATFTSSVNRFLPNLQFESYPARVYVAASGASLDTFGLVAGALQDNGIVFSFDDAGTQTPWKQLMEGDGFMAIFLKNDLLLFWNNEEDEHPPPARVAKWTGAQFGSPVDVPVRTPSPSVPQGNTFVRDPLLEPSEAGPVVESVLHPNFQREDPNQLMIGVAAYNASGLYQDLWGLFADHDGANPAWDFLATVSLDPGDGIQAAVSDDGFTVLAGSLTGKIFSLDVRSGAVNAMGIDPSIRVPLGQVFQFAFLKDGSAIVRYARDLLRLEPATRSWTTIGRNGLPSNEGSFFSIAVDTTRDPEILYAATDFGIHASWDAGANWLPVSQGLPVRSHPSTLRFVVEPDGTRRLYLFTFGRSAWRARLN
jgi:hypothetical protein